MAEWGRTWSGAPSRWAAPAPGPADPTGGRHAFDAEAAATPIFTALRRGDWRRDDRFGPVPHPAAPRPARSGPPFGHDDPPTMLIPVVRSHDESPGVAYAGVPDPARRHLDDAGYASAHDPAYDPAYDDTDHEPVGYEPVRYDAAAYDPGYDAAAYDPGYDSAAYDPAAYDPAAYDPAAYDRPEPQAWAPVPRSDDRGRYPVYPGRPGAWPATGEHALVTDTGRHHRRLAPAGW